jgi:hypothetical protein
VLPAKAKQKLGWMSEFAAQHICKEMVASDLAHGRQMALLNKHGYRINVSVE